MIANLEFMLETQDPIIGNQHFLFADHLLLDDSPTRDFYKELLRGLAAESDSLLDDFGEAVAGALLLHGPEGKKVLDEIASGPEDDKAKQVKYWLERADNVRLPPPWPKPKPGSLPTNLDACPGAMVPEDEDVPEERDPFGGSSTGPFG